MQFPKWLHGQQAEVKNKAVEGMRNVITGIADVFKDIGSMFGVGKNMVEGIWNGISWRYEVDKKTK